MATNDTTENQDHEAGDDGYPNKFIDRDNEPIDHHVGEDREDCGQQVHKEKGSNLNMNETNGREMSMTAMEQSTDTITTNTTTSTSTLNSPSQSTQEQHEQDESLTTDAIKQELEEHDNDNGNVKLSGDSDAHDGDDEDDEDDLEEGELKDDDDDDDDDDDELANDISKNRLSNLSNNDNNNNSSGQAKDSSAYVAQRLPNDPNLHNNNNSNYGGPPRPYHQQHNRRHFLANQPQLPAMQHPQFHPNQIHFPGNSNNNYRSPPNQDCGGPPPPVMMPQMNHNQPPVPGDMCPRGGPVSMGPVQKVNVRCRFYSRTSNKCTWGDHCRFEHRDESPGPNEGFDDRLSGPEVELLQVRGQHPVPPPPMGAAERPYPPYPGRHPPYGPPMGPHIYGYGQPYDQQQYGPHHSTSPPLPPHPMPPHLWRPQNSPCQSVAVHSPESVSPALLTNNVIAPTSSNSNSSGRGMPPQAPSGSSTAPPVPSSGGAPSPSYSSPSSSAVYERKSRLAYEAAPWNDRNNFPPTRYERGDPTAGYPAYGRGYYRNHYSRDPYGREPPPPHMGGAYPYPSGYHVANYPSAYRGGPPIEPHVSQYRYSSSSQRTVPPDVKRPRSKKRSREDDSSWSESGSDDSLLELVNSRSKSQTNKISKKYQRTSTQATSEDTAVTNTPAAVKEQVDQGGSGTPPGEPIPEDRERQEKLLNKLKLIEDLMAKKKTSKDEQ